MQTLLNNRYQVIRTLGGGGFGETFLAEDTQMPSKRRCVIKQLRPIHNNPQIYQLVQERFQREAAILEDLGGITDQIPTLYAYFQLEGQFYLVQEWIEGDTLTAKVHRQGLFSESAVKELLVNLLPVLENVHNKRIVHRDIKPDNIILRQRDAKPVLIDFGAVRESMGTVVNSQGNPTSSIVIGTPGFMPSEQAAGRPVYSSDLYSLGITAIYLLTGKQPQELETDSRSGEIIWRSHALSVSPTLAGVIDQAIAYHPRERFATAREMLEALYSGTAAAFPPTMPYAQTQPTVNVAPPVTMPNTVAVSPGTVNQGSGHKGILLGSLIVGGLVGGAIVVGLILSKSTEPIVQSTNSSVSSSNRNESPDTNTLPPNINNEPRDNIPTEQPDINTPPPNTNNEPRDNIPTEQPDTNTSVPSPTPSAQISSPPQPEVERTSPEAAIQSYYATINQGQYQTAWNQLAPSYQSNRRLHPNGYLSYIDWWGGQVQNVDVEQVSLIQENAETATVNAQLKYLLKTKKVVTSSVRFSLLWDAENSRWVISGTK
ncbi:MAG: protein kinase [Desmonostoc vinosum HA7617-LM4]|jgi:serine/threonine-protein kinase|nr:protein kinase [Desmonostoc vinosum HA7617-LM4]